MFNHINTPLYAAIYRILSIPNSTQTTFTSTRIIFLDLATQQRGFLLQSLYNSNEKIKNNKVNKDNTITTSFNLQSGVSYINQITLTKLQSIELFFLITSFEAYVVMSVCLSFQFINHILIQFINL